MCLSLCAVIISPVDELFNEFDSKLYLNFSVTVIRSATPSLGPNLCYWPGEDELSAGEKKKIKGFEMVNGTLQWLIEEIYITNCLSAQ